MSTFPTFDEFYVAAHGFAPFPWQSRLAQQVLESGWPEVLDLPTGSGKTTTLEIALYALAAAPRRMPRRIVLVVDRRIVVDQASVVARALQKRLFEAHDGPLAVVAAALRALFEGETARDVAPFEVAVMRGGMPRDNDWARRPDVPLLGVSTVDQIGSRLLFRGYGLSELATPIHAGLVGNDTLILLDEVHLANPFAETLRAIRARYRAAEVTLPDRFVIVEMSATTRERDVIPFGLAKDDREHVVLAHRLAARKRAQLVEVSVAGDDERKRQVFANALAEQAIRMLGAETPPHTLGIVVNRIHTAIRVSELVRSKLAATHDVILLTGRMRALDRDKVVAQVLERAGTGRDRSALAAGRGLVIVATQCIEAGADLDLDALISECASLDALRQRFGRLDRAGKLGNSTGVIVARGDQVKQGAAADPVYGPSLANTWDWLQAVALDGAVDFGIDALSQALATSQADSADVFSPAPSAPVLLPETLDALAQTSIPPHYDPDVSLWLHGPQRISADVQVVWRDEVPSQYELLAQEGSAPSEDVAAAVRDQLAARRPSSLETIALPIYLVRHWLAEANQQTGQTPDVADAPLVEAEPPRRRRGSKLRPRIPVLVWRGDESQWLEDLDTLRPGATLIVSPSAGGIAAFNFNPDATDPVPDRGTEAGWKQRGEIVLRGTPDALATVATHKLQAPEVDATEPPAAVRAEWTAALMEWLQAMPALGERSLTTELRAVKGARRVHVSLLPGLVSDVPVPYFRIRGTRGGNSHESVSEDDGSAFADRRVTLAAHNNDVASWASRFCRGLALPEGVAADVALAAAWHDLGKADPRFQAWLLGGNALEAAAQTELLAKSAGSDSVSERNAARRRAAYPAQYRHELLSVALVQSAPALLARANDPDLVLHLIASHHGWCRPFAPLVDPGPSLPVNTCIDGVQLAADARHSLASLDGGVMDRYGRLTERYGWWGLAWLESIVRLADHRASERPAWNEESP